VAAVERQPTHPTVMPRNVQPPNFCGATQKLQSVASSAPIAYDPCMISPETRSVRELGSPRTGLFGTALVVALALAIPGCGKDNKPSTGGPPATRGAPPPPSAEAAPKPGACKDGGGEVKDPVSAPFLPRTVAGYCINPDGETNAFGDKAPKPMDGICALFDGGCEIYKTHQVKRTVSVDYIDGAGSAATVTTILSQFATSEQAYAMFTHRVTSDEDPARPDIAKKVDVGAPAALGTGTLFACKGTYLLELSYVNTAESGDANQLRQSANKVLPPIGKDILGRLPGSSAPPDAVAKLPTDEQLPLGVSLVLKDALGAPGTGVAAIGYYKTGEKRYRVLSLVKKDADQAKDVLKTFAKEKGATEEKNLAEGAVRLMVQESPTAPKAEWIVARQGNVLLGVGDEPFVLGPGSTLENVALSKDDKIKKLRAILPAKLSFSNAFARVPFGRPRGRGSPPRPLPGTHPWISSFPSTTTCCAPPSAISSRKK
jgi:hypothetical protein